MWPWGMPCTLPHCGSSQKPGYYPGLCKNLCPLKKKRGGSTLVMAWVYKWFGNETPPCDFFILGWLSLASGPEKGSWPLLPQDEIRCFCISPPSSCILPPFHQALWMAESCGGQYRSSLTCHCWSCSLGWESGERGVPRSLLSSAPGKRWGPPPGGRRSTCASFHTCQGALQKQRGACERGRVLSPEVLHELAVVCIPPAMCPPGGAEQAVIRMGSGDRYLYFFTHSA